MAEAKEFYVAKEIFYVATEFHRVVLRQSVVCRDLVGQGKETSCRNIRVSCRDRTFLCRDRVGNGGEALCRDIIFYVATEYGQMERFCVATSNSMS